jgi:hypothetical protein
MPKLRETQRHFTNFALRDMGRTQASNGIKGNGFSPEQRLAIYRNNTQLGLTEALRDGYQVINRLVGDAFFKHLAQQYIHRYPPKSGCLLNFGGQMAEFIAQFPPTQGLPYLADTARLEWLWHETFHEADANHLNADELAELAPESHSRLGFTLQPSVRFLDSDYPILKIWQSNQSDSLGNEPINLDDGCCNLLLVRPALAVEIYALPDSEFQFLGLLHAGLNLTRKVEQITLKDSSFDVAGCLQRWFSYGLFSGLILNALIHDK